MPYGPDSQDWKYGKLFLQDIITKIDKRLWDIYHNQELPEQVVIPIGEDIAIIVLDDYFRHKLQEIYLKAGWREAELQIHCLCADDEEFEPATERQLQILIGEIEPDEDERPIPAYWQIILRK